MEQKLTEELIHEIENTQKVEDYLDCNRSELINSRFHEYMKKLLTEKSLKKTDIVSGSNLNRAYVYQIFSGSKVPSRDKVIALGFGYKLDLSEMQRFLKQAGYRELYARDKRDAILIFALNKDLDIVQTNELIDNLSEQILE